MQVGSRKEGEAAGFKYFLRSEAASATKLPVQRRSPVVYTETQPIECTGFERVIGRASQQERSYFEGTNELIG